MKGNADAARRSTVESLLRVVHTNIHIYIYINIQIYKYINIYKTRSRRKQYQIYILRREHLVCMYSWMSIEWVGLLIRLHSNCWLDLSLFMNFFLGWKILLSGEKMCEAYLKQVDENLKNGWKKGMKCARKTCKRKERKKSTIKFIGILETRTINIIMDEFFLRFTKRSKHYAFRALIFLSPIFSSRL